MSASGFVIRAFSLEIFRPCPVVSAKNSAVGRGSLPASVFGAAGVARASGFASAGVIFDGLRPAFVAGNLNLAARRNRRSVPMCVGAWWLTCTEL